MALDHGILNTPLNKRGNFHKELDDHLAAELKRKKKAAQDAKFLNEEARKEAWRRFALIDKDQLKHHADKRDMRPNELKEVVRSMCNDRPRAALKVLELFTKAA
ncbi:hypothetical protein RSG06_002218 [Yersinia enterocolitica]|nr:hypothetical protein [Yersinia enterocolitica]